MPYIGCCQVVVSPVGREQGGLAQALQDLAHRWRETQSANVQCRVQLSDARELEPMLADNFYHIAQEALTNAIQHSGASEIVMELRQSRRHLSLTVTDDGCGFPPAAEHGNGLGLKIMRGRAELAGAQLKVEAEAAAVLASSASTNGGPGVAEPRLRSSAAHRRRAAAACSGE